MSYYKLGPILRQRRIALGYTQEELADGICAVNTLSRYENGERIPNKEHMELLLQRLGLSDAIFDAFIDEKTFRLHELKYQIRQAIMENREDDARILLREYEQKADRNSILAKQFILLYQTWLDENLSSLEMLERFEQAMKLTCPRYVRHNLPEFFSYEELILLNAIAAQLYYSGSIEDAINILYFVNARYDDSFASKEEIIRTQPMIIYNLSKFLGNAARYDECIDICDHGIRVAQKTGRCFLLCATFYNKAWALVRRKRAGDMDAAKEAALSAKYAAICMGQDELLNHVEQFIQKTFTE